MDVVQLDTRRRSLQEENLHFAGTQESGDRFERQERRCFKTGSSSSGGVAQLETPLHEQHRQMQSTMAHHGHQQDRPTPIQQQQQQHKQKQKQQQGAFIRGADRRALQSLRVIRRTLVYAIGLSPNFSQVETLKQPEYFGQYGEITKLVINHHHGVAPDDPRHGSTSAYITFSRQEDAWAAICSVDGFRLMGRTIRASFGTTKYCNSFLRNLPCNNPDCLYLHELGDQDDRFTKDEVQLGLARHGSSFAFKEEVLTGGVPGGRCVPTNPVLPPPCSMPQAPYLREGVKHHMEGGLPHHHPHHHHSSNAVASGIGACHSHGNHFNGRGFPRDAAATAAATGVTPGSPAALGAGLRSDGRPRQRRRRGQRGRRGAGNGDGGGEGSGGGALGVAGPPGAYGEMLAAPAGGRRDPPAGGSVFHLPDHLSSAPPSLARGFDFGSGLLSGHLYRTVDDPAQALGASDRSTGSRSSSSTYSGSSTHSSSGGRRGSGNSWDVGCGSPALTPETLRNTPPLEVSHLEGFSPPSASAFFLGAVAGGDDADRTQQHHARSSPTFFGASDPGTRQGALDDEYQLLQQQQLLQLQRLRQLHQGNGDGAAAGGAEQLLAITEDRGVLDLRQLNQQRVHHHLRHHQQQQRYEAGRDDRATLAALQQQVHELQRYVENGVAAGTGGGDGASPTPPGLGFPDGSAPAGSVRSFSDELSIVGDCLSALSWGDDDIEATAIAIGDDQSVSRHLSGGGIGIGGGRVPDWREDGAAVFSASPSPLDGFGSLALASAASQAEASQWRRAAPRLFAS